jgi:hypothetical protein
VVIAVLCALLSAFAALRDYRQRHRRDLDRISPVPWGFLSVLSLFVAIASFATALHAAWN